MFFFPLPNYSFQSYLQSELPYCGYTATLPPVIELFQPWQQETFVFVGCEKIIIKELWIKLVCDSHPATQRQCDWKHVPLLPLCLTFMWWLDYISETNRICNSSFSISPNVQLIRIKKQEEIKATWSFCVCKKQNLKVGSNADGCMWGCCENLTGQMRQGICATAH